MKRALIFLLMVPAAVLCLGLLSISFLVLQLYPPYITGTAVVVLLIVAAWFIFGRRRDDSAGTFSESAFGTKSTKEGLL